MAHSRAPRTKVSVVAKRPAGRPAMDREEGFVYFASLPDGRRTYRAVAERFGVSVRTVERHGREGGWRERVQRHKRDAARTVDEELTGKQVDALFAYMRLIEKTTDRYDEHLDADKVKLTPSDLGRMISYHQQVGDRLETLAQSNPVGQRIAAPTDEQRLEHKLDVLRNLVRAGQLDELLEVLDPTRTNGSITPEEDSQ